MTETDEDEVLAVAKAYCEAKSGHAVPDPKIFPTWVKLATWLRPSRQ